MERDRKMRPAVSLCKAFSFSRGVITLLNPRSLLLGALCCVLAATSGCAYTSTSFEAGEVNGKSTTLALFKSGVEKNVKSIEGTITHGDTEVLIESSGEVNNLASDVDPADVAQTIFRAAAFAKALEAYGMMRMMSP